MFSYFGSLHPLDYAVLDLERLCPGRESYQGNHVR